MPDYSSLISNLFNQNPNLINYYYNQGMGDLTRLQGTAGNQARSTMGSLAASRGLLNPSAAITGAGSQAMGQFNPMFGQLAQQRTGMQLQNNNAYANSLMGMWGLDLQQQQLNAMKNPNVFDYLGLGLGALSLPMTGGESPQSLLGYLLK